MCQMGVANNAFAINPPWQHMIGSTGTGPLQQENQRMVTVLNKHAITQARSTHRFCLLKTR